MSSQYQKNQSPSTRDHARNTAGCTILSLFSGGVSLLTAGLTLAYFPDANNFTSDSYLIRLLGSMVGAGTSLTALTVAGISGIAATCHGYQTVRSFLKRD